MEPKWKPTVVLNHAENIAINAVISPSLAQKIFRLVTDEVNGIAEGPEIEAIKPEDKIPVCKHGRLIGFDCRLLGWHRFCEEVNSTVKACEHDPKKNPEMSFHRSPCSVGEKCVCGGNGGMVIASEGPTTPVKLCAVEDCPEPANEGDAVCKEHGGGMDPKKIHKEKKAGA